MIFRSSAILVAIVSQYSLGMTTTDKVNPTELQHHILKVLKAALLSVFVQDINPFCLAVKTPTETTQPSRCRCVVREASPAGGPIVCPVSRLAVKRIISGNDR